MTPDAESRARFVDEARAASALDHPNVETIYDVGESSGGRLYMAMAYYRGETLDEVIRNGALEVGDAVSYARQVARGLGAVHERGIVHRDVKPANLMVSPDGVLKILDFGIARTSGPRLTRTGVTLGTPHYMSPEQARGEAIGTQSHLWSLGVVFYEMLTGSRPFDSPDPLSVLHQICNNDPPPLAPLRGDVPPGLEAVVERCLTRDSEGRYPDASAF